MKKFYSQKQIYTTVDKPMLWQIERYINKTIPSLLLLNLEKGRENPLSDYTTVILHKQFYGEFLRSIDEYANDYFDDSIHKVTFELAHDNRFNFFGHKTIVLIINFDRATNLCHFSIAVNDEDGKNKLSVIEKDILAILQRNKKPAVSAKLLSNILID